MKMKRLSSVCLLLLVSVMATPTNSNTAGKFGEFSRQVSIALNTMKTEKFFDKFLDVKSSMGKLASMLGPGGALVSVVASLLGGESAEMEAIKELHYKTDLIISEVRSLSKNLPAVVADELRHFQMQKYESELITAIEHYEDYLEFADGTTPGSENHALYTMALNKIRKTCGEINTDQIVNHMGVMLDSETERNKFYQAHDHNYQRIDATMKYLEKMVLLAAEARSACLYVSEHFLDASQTDRNLKAVHDGDKWEEQVANLRVHLDPIRKQELVKVIVDDKLYQKEVDKWMKAHTDLGHQEFADSLKNQLKTKFSFGDDVGFTVLSLREDYVGTDYEGMITHNPGRYNEGSLQILAQYGRSVSVFWAYCKAVVANDIKVAVSSWDGLLSQLKGCYPNIYSMKYFYRPWEEQYGIAVTYDKYIVDVREALFSGWKFLLLTQTKCGKKSGGHENWLQDCGY